VRLQKALQALARLGDDRFRRAAARLSGLALARARHAGVIAADLQALAALAGQTGDPAATAGAGPAQA
jgi:hypothetical protein